MNVPSESKHLTDDPEAKNTGSEANEEDEFLAPELDSTPDSGNMGKKTEKYKNRIYFIAFFF